MILSNSRSFKTDTKIVEDAFRDRMDSLETEDVLAPAETPSSNLAYVAVPQSNTDVNADLGERVSESTEKIAPAEGSPETRTVDKSALGLAEPRRYRNKEHLRSVVQQPCLLCGRYPCDPHHLRFTQPRALGKKASDEFVVPLCRIHHREVHRAGDERAWWQAAGVDPVKVARKLWRSTRPKDGALTPNLRSALSGVAEENRPDASNEKASV